VATVAKSPEEEDVHTCVVDMPVEVEAAAVAIVVTVTVGESRKYHYYLLTHHIPYAM
jgi:hypothetical protein